MASFNFGGIEGLEITIKDLIAMTEEEKRAIIEPAAQVYRAKLKEVLARVRPRDNDRPPKWQTGQLIESITLTPKFNADGEPIAVIGASGKRKGAFTGRRKRKLTGKGDAIKYGKHKRNGMFNGMAAAGHYSGTNTELLYMLENGTPRMRAYHPVETAEKESEEEVFAAFSKGWDEYLKSKNL